MCDYSESEHSDYEHSDCSDSCTEPVTDKPFTAGAKGSDVYTAAGVQDPRVVFSTRLVRGTNESILHRSIHEILRVGTTEMVEDAAVMTFQARDVRGGKGERDLFYEMMRAIYRMRPELAASLLDLIPEYGSWGDMFKLAEIEEGLRTSIFAIAKAQLEKDAAAASQERGKLSLLAKWAPREGKASGKLAVQFARYLAEDSDVATGTASVGAKKTHSRIMAAYRHRLSLLNRTLQTVEVMECANRWEDIEPRRVPARARTIKHAAYLNEINRYERKKRGHNEGIGPDGKPFLRHPASAVRMACRSEFQRFYKAVAAGKVRVSGANTMYPHELVKRVREGAGTLTTEEKANLNAMWAEMVKRVLQKGGLGSSLLMCDFSGSMSSGSKAGAPAPILISIAMGLLGAAACAPPFQGRFMTFDSTPKWHTIPPELTTLTDQLLHMDVGSLGQGLSTDFQAAGELILKELKEARAPPGTSPKNLIVVTDMGFDQACNSAQTSAYTGNRYRHNVKTEATQTHAQMLREAFRRASEDVHGDPEAWPAPRIVIWNVAAWNAEDHQAHAHEEGVLTLSGWSPTTFQVLCEEGPRAITPYEVLRQQLDAPRYEPVRKRVREWLAGGWRGVL